MSGKSVIPAYSAKSTRHLGRDFAPIVCETTYVPLPRVVKEGWLFKRRELLKSWEKRYFVLLEDGSFLGFKSRPEVGEYSDSCHNFTVSGCQIMTKNEPRRSIFIVRGLRAKHIERSFSVRSDAERTIWIAAIQIVDQKREESWKHGDALSSSHVDRFSKVTLDDFEFIRTLGKGTFGEVLMCREKSSDHVLAIKIMKKEIDPIGEEAVQQITTECRVLQQTRHPFLTSMEYSFETKDQLCIAMEFVSGGELALHLARENTFSEEKSRFYGAEILLGLEYLHQRGIIHRDLKMENILLAADGHIKIADFGLSKENMYYGATTRTFCGTPRYTAPEMCLRNGYGQAVDWWSFGVVMYRMMTGSFPFCCTVEGPLFQMIMEDDVDFPASLTFNAVALLDGLLRKNPEWRLGGGERGAEEIKEHEFFLGVEWEQLLARKITPPLIPQLSSETDTRYFDWEFTAESIRLIPGDLLEAGSVVAGSLDSRQFSNCHEGEEQAHQVGPEPEGSTEKWSFSKVIPWEAQ